MLQALIPAAGGAGTALVATLAITGVILSHQSARHTAGRTLHASSANFNSSSVTSPALLCPSMTGRNFTSSTTPKSFIKIQIFLINAALTEFHVEHFT